MLIHCIYFSCKKISHTALNGEIHWITVTVRACKIRQIIEVGTSKTTDKPNSWLIMNIHHNTKTAFLRHTKDWYVWEMNRWNRRNVTHFVFSVDHKTFFRNLFCCIACKIWWFSSRLPHLRYIPPFGDQIN